MKLPSWMLLVVPLSMFYFGIGLNTIVMMANHNQMPVLEPYSCEQFDDYHGEEDRLRHSCMTKDTRLKFLADILRFPWLHGIFSLGDIFIELGDLLQIPCFWGWVFLMAYRHRILTD